MPPTASGQGEPCAAEPRNAHQWLKKLIPPSRLAPEASKFQSPPTHAKRFCKRLNLLISAEERAGEKQPRGRFRRPLDASAAA